MSKITIWSFIIGLLSLSVTLVSVPSDSVSGNQTSYGSQSPSINQNNGTIIYNNQDKAREKGYVLSRSTPVMASPNLNKLGEKDNLVCSAVEGTQITMLQSQEESPLPMLRKVLFKSGECKGKMGWISTESIALQ